VALRFACERWSAWPPKKTTSPGSTTAATSRPSYSAATAASSLREAISREAVATAASALPTAPSLLAHLAGAALWRYIGDAERGRPERARPVNDARRFIHANLHDPTLTLDDIADAAHVTPAHLIRSFRAENGTTPKACLWERRVALGIDLLVNTGLSIPTVAERCGFRTAHHFSRR
jgi:transcriptional regulator GlxA family with amidase domain